MKCYGNVLFKKELSRLNMNIYECAYADLDSKWNSENAKASYDRIYYVTKGEGEISYHGETVKLLPGKVYIIPAELEYSYSCKESLEKLFFHINILKYNNYDVFLGVNKCIVLDNREEEIKSIIHAWNRSDAASTIFVKALLYKTVSDAIDVSGARLGGIKEYSETVRKAIGFIEDNLLINISCEQIASALFVSPSFLQKQFKKETGVSIGKYFDDRIMFVAENKIRTTTASVKSISESLGFCDQFYFSRKFANKFGVPPVKYRQRANLY